MVAKGMGGIIMQLSGLLPPPVPKELKNSAAKNKADNCYARHKDADDNPGDVRTALFFDDCSHNAADKGDDCEYDCNPVQDSQKRDQSDERENQRND
ncbi:MAG: hypothetical protein K2I74_06495 [Treponemataceae bacterium]|nr:hypothetical protein [Treponemataceae bacterium]